MNKIEFTKLHGAGNDFILIDEIKNPQLEITGGLITKMCDRHFGIGADGLLVIRDCDEADFKMEYYNSDGSSGMLCGNGARSIIKYADVSGRITGGKTKFLFNDELFYGEVLDDNLISFHLNEPSKINVDFEMEVLGDKIRASFIDTGAHHVVIDIDENQSPKLEDFPVAEYGRAIRYSARFNPPGTNVNFISIKNNIINIRTYERGVEEETLACGTGSVAVAIISYLKKNISPPVRVRTKSNEELIINFKDNNSKLKNITLAGPAKIVFDGKYKI